MCQGIPRISLFEAFLYLCQKKETLHGVFDRGIGGQSLNGIEYLLLYAYRGQDILQSFVAERSLE